MSYKSAQFFSQFDCLLVLFFLSFSSLFLALQNAHASFGQIFTKKAWRKRKNGQRSKRTREKKRSHFVMAITCDIIFCEYRGNVCHRQKPNCWLNMKTLCPYPYDAIQSVDQMHLSHRLTCTQMNDVNGWFDWKLLQMQSTIRFADRNDVIWFFDQPESVY